MRRIVLTMSICAALMSCMSYLTTDRGEALVYGIDIDQSLKIAKMELEKGGDRKSTRLNASHYS